MITVKLKEIWKMSVRALRKSVLSTIIFLMLGACATNIETKQSLNVGLREKLEITNVVVNALPEARAKPTLLTNLRSAVLVELRTINAYGQIGTLELLVTKARMISQGKRSLFGALAGSDLLYVTATIKDEKTQAIVAQFEIKGDYNPGGLGMFVNPKRYTAKRVAEALVKEIYRIQ